MEEGKIRVFISAMNQQAYLHSLKNWFLSKPMHYYFQFAGVIDDVSATMDITNRTDVLRVIDKGKVTDICCYFFQGSNFDQV